VKQALVLVAGDWLLVLVAGTGCWYWSLVGGLSVASTSN